MKKGLWLRGNIGNIQAVLRWMGKMTLGEYARLAAESE